SPAKVRKGDRGSSLESAGGDLGAGVGAVREPQVEARTDRERPDREGGDAADRHPGAEPGAADVLAVEDRGEDEGERAERHEAGTSRRGDRTDGAARRRSHLRVDADAIAVPREREAIRRNEAV